MPGLAVPREVLTTITTTGTFTPAVSGWYLVEMLGAGGSGGGGGTSASGTALQTGGAGGGAGMYTQQMLYLTAGATYTATVGVKNATRPTGGAAGGNAGVAGKPGAASSFAGPGIPTLYADGGSGGNPGGANSTGTANAGCWGAGTPGHTTSVSGPGNGGIATNTQGFGAVPSPFGVGGTGGAPATAGGLGGLGGSAATSWGRGLAAVSGNTGADAAGQGADATLYGSGGAGGGGANSGAAGGGGLGMDGVVNLRLVA